MSINSVSVLFSHYIWSHRFREEHYFSQDRTVSAVVTDESPNLSDLENQRLFLIHEKAISVWMNFLHLMAMPFGTQVPPGHQGRE